MSMLSLIKPIIPRAHWSVDHNNNVLRLLRKSHSDCWMDGSRSDCQALFGYNCSREQLVRVM